MRRISVLLFEWCPVCFWPEGGGSIPNLERASGKKLTFSPRSGLRKRGGAVVGRVIHTLWRRNFTRNKHNASCAPEIIDNRQRRRVMGGRKVYSIPVHLPVMIIIVVIWSRYSHAAGKMITGDYF
ncbi:hypothetical protein LSTR_LSTR012932 [Laodelphax striatellus]|uniref:Uncharacterized protein n=1 Tax=Laodelphax striatellus TaxID=195883 RepID=A0A482X746_LAOST|nr:hypothetical protein LSTR_LSTR012932 [Laodelphax striatellus]